MLQNGPATGETGSKMVGSGSGSKCRKQLMRPESSLFHQSFLWTTVYRLRCNLIFLGPARGWVPETPKFQVPFPTVNPSMFFGKKVNMGFPGGSGAANLPASAGDMGLIPCPRGSNWAQMPQVLNQCSGAQELWRPKPEHPRACALQRERPLQWKAHAPQLSGSCSLQLKKKPKQQQRRPRDPAQQPPQKNKQTKKPTQHLPSMLF